MSIQLANSLAIALNALADGELTETSLPSGARVGLETRVRELTLALAPPAASKVRAVVAQLGTMPTQTEDDDARRRMIFDQFLTICADVPEWALEWAAVAFLRNEATREGGAAPSKFRPTAGEFRAFAMRRVHEVAAERERIAKVLRAKVAPPSKPLDLDKRKALADLIRQATRPAAGPE